MLWLCQKLDGKWCSASHFGFSLFEEQTGNHWCTGHQWYSIRCKDKHNVHARKSFRKNLRQAPGDAYLFAVTTKRIRLHLDRVQKAFYAESTGLYLKPT